MSLISCHSDAILSSRRRRSTWTRWTARIEMCSYLLYVGWALLLGVRFRDLRRTQRTKPTKSDTLHFQPHSYKLYIRPVRLYVMCVCARRANSFLDYLKHAIHRIEILFVRFTSSRGGGGEIRLNKNEARGKKDGKRIRGQIISRREKKSRP